MPTNLIPKRQSPARKPQFGWRIWYTVIVACQPFLLIGCLVGVVFRLPGLTILCLLMLVSSSVWVTLLAIVHGKLHLLPRLLLLTWGHMLRPFTQPRVGKRMLVTTVYYAIPMCLRMLLIVPFIVVGMGSEAYTHKVSARYWQKEEEHLANHRQRLHRMGLLP